MNLTQVEYFLAIAEKLNFTAAAKSLFVSQPALSKQIALLEEELDTKLFVRSSKKVTLTRAGEQFEKDLRQIIRQMDEAKKHAWKIGREEKERLRIGCFDGAVTDDFLPRVFQRTKEISPNLEIEMCRENFVTIRQALKNGDVDIIFTLDFELAELYEYHSREIARRTGCLIYSEKFPLAQKKDLQLSDFSEETLLIMSPANSSGGYYSAMRTLKEANIHPKKIEKMNDMVTLLTYVEMGYGYTLLDGAVADHRKGLLKKAVEVEANHLSVVAVWKETTPLIEQILEVFS